MQNVSHAVMAQRNPADKDSLDYFPTPPWATRALCEHVISEIARSSHACLEPACGEGHMARPLQEYFSSVTASDIADYGYGDVRDFLKGTQNITDWVITNPPFNRAQEFITVARGIARVGVAMLVRISFLESVGRYEFLFGANPPDVAAVFSERVPMVKGRLDRKASTATSYVWLVWYRPGSPFSAPAPRLMWIPPCRKRLERNSDYEVAW